MREPCRDLPRRLKGLITNSVYCALVTFLYSKDNFKENCRQEHISEMISFAFASQKKKKKAKETVAFNQKNTLSLHFKNKTIF